MVIEVAGARTPLITSFRHELCEQIQRLGGVVTIPEIIDLTILLRPPMKKLGPRVPPSPQQRMACAVARAAVETEAMMEQPRFQIRRVGRQDRRLVFPGIGHLCREFGQIADKLAEADPLPPPIRVFQELYEFSSRNFPMGVNPSATSGS